MTDESAKVTVEGAWEELLHAYPGQGTVIGAEDAARALALAAHDALCHWCWRSFGTDDEMLAAMTNCDERKKIEALGR